MYEIPPSVDRYLRISSRSMIHFPAISLETSLGSTSFQTGSSSSPRKLLLSDHEFVSSNLDSTDGKCLAESPKRKRTSEDDEEETLPDPKHLKTQYMDSVNGFIEARPLDTNKQRATEPVVTLANLEQRMGQRVHEQGHYEYERRRHEPQVRKLPEIKPKIVNEDSSSSFGSPATWTYTNGRAVTRKNPWGPQSYSELISGAIRASPDHRASLQQIYDWIVKNVSYFNDKANYPSTKGWKNAIRHTLSIRKRFSRIVNDRSPHASLWTFSRHGYRGMNR